MTDKPDNWMPLYIGSYMKKTTRLTREQHGTYLLLIMDSWVNGPPPDDDRVLASIVKASPIEWRRLRPVIEPFFQVEDGKWCHDKIDRERERATDIIEKRRTAGAAGGSAARGKSGRKKNSGKIASAIPVEIADGIANQIPNELQKNTPLPSQSHTVPLAKANGRPAAQLALGDTPAKDDPWREVYAFGKQLLGHSAGGIITNLRKTLDDKPRKVLAKLQDAAEQRTPLEWINAFLWKFGPPGLEGIGPMSSAP